MEKFTSIAAFKNVVSNTRKYYSKANIPLPTRTFEGTAKLHGTNAGVFYNSHTKELTAQSREHTISVGSDNAGFAFFVETHKEAIANLFKVFPGAVFPEGSYPEGAFPSGVPMLTGVTLYGEWCGGSIQKKVALAQVPKHWVLFAAKIHLPDGTTVVVDYTDDDEAIEESAMYFELPRDLHDNANGIYNIYQIPTYEVEVDFLSPEPASVILSDLTLAVEKEDPWVKLMFGLSGIGEGIVWHLKDDPTESRGWFKTKGLLHKNEGDTSKVGKILIDDQKLASIKELVTVILPEWRLEQGLTYLREENIEVDPKSTGAYLKWIMTDIFKEELPTIAAAGFELKQVQGELTRVARNFFLAEAQKVE